MTASSEAIQLANLLASTNQRVVFAESCTGGLVAALLAQVPGVSEHFCGSAVTYREATKRLWLGVSAEDLAKFTAQSEQIALQMATGVLVQTPEADIALSIVGHLGPDAPVDIDGVVFVGIATRESDQSTAGTVTRHTLDASDREARQIEAARLVLQHAIQAISTLR